MQINTPRLIIRPLQRADVDAIAIWQPFTDPLLAQYNLLAHESTEERDQWFTGRTSDLTRREFAVTDISGQVVGRIGLREIDGQQCARLGVMIGAEFIDRGYGSEALVNFLIWYFGEGGFARIVLDVAASNPRAVHVYNKLGFRKLMDRYELVDESAVAFLDDPLYDDVRQYFRRENGQTWALFYEMELTHEEWQPLQAKILLSVRTEPVSSGAKNG
jgi:diamine N-acetyltransferase